MLVLSLIAIARITFRRSLFFRIAASAGRTSFRHDFEQNGLTSVARPVEFIDAGSPQMVQAESLRNRREIHRSLRRHPAFRSLTHHLKTRHFIENFTSAIINHHNGNNKLYILSGIL